MNYYLIYIKKTYTFGEKKYKKLIKIYYFILITKIKIQNLQKKIMKLLKIYYILITKIKI